MLHGWNMDTRGTPSRSDNQTSVRSGSDAQVTEVAREDPLQLSRNTVQEQTAVIAFTALYYSGLPFQVRPSLVACSVWAYKTSLSPASVLSSC